MCPFLDRADARCAAHLTFRNVTRALAHCVDCYGDCPIYQELVVDAQEQGQPRRAERLRTAS